MNYIKLTKIKATVRPNEPTDDEEKNNNLLLEMMLLPDGYTIEGWLISPIRIGHPVQVWRMVRNGIAVPGRFTSSPVIEIISATGFTTENSHYAWLPSPDLRWPCFAHVPPIEIYAFRRWLQRRPLLHSVSAPRSDLFHPEDYLTWKSQRPL